VVRGNASAIVALPTAAETVRFAVEDFPAIHVLGAWMQVGDERFDSEGIRRLDERDDYPCDADRVDA
jgi:hypothetical protein